MLATLQKQFPWISHADLWTLAGATAIEYMGGPHIPWRPGRSDKPDGSYCPPDGRLPDASLGAAHVRDVFGRMGFSDREAVALIGAHCLGRCHTDRSGYDGPWTNAPTTFSNLYFKELTEKTWRKKVSSMGDFAIFIAIDWSFACRVPCAAQTGLCMGGVLWSSLQRLSAPAFLLKTPTSASFACRSGMAHCSMSRRMERP